ncbi:uncharacterized protein LOC128210325 isoform X2 [Mya arenaria]|uniref:uncharacterized protein LOC128210325 isoform X2 n=1 Tax=Mya arenaria TaxID=6604 RepID=UPI0022DF4C65|nr:uncharacterized protein LOC128210325 isoform X2 [Mya arenaria]
MAVLKHVFLLILSTVGLVRSYDYCGEILSCAEGYCCEDNTRCCDSLWCTCSPRDTPGIHAPTPDRTGGIHAPTSYSTGGICQPNGGPDIILSALFKVNQACTLESYGLTGWNSLRLPVLFFLKFLCCE